MNFVPPLVLFVLLILPWVSPFASGPSPGVVPWLVTLACVGAAALVLVFANKTMAKSQTTRTQEDRWAVEIEPVVYAWLVAGLMSCAIAGVQYFGVAAAFEPWVNQTRYGEAFANLRQRNQFATLTSIALASLLWLLLQNAKSETLFRQRAAAVWLGGLSVSLLMMGNAVSASRTGLLQLVLLFILCGVWGQWRQPVVRWVLGGAALAYAIAAFAMPYAAGLDAATHSAFGRLGDDAACNSRRVLWSNVLTLIAQKPWLGWGWGELDYAHYMTLYEGPRFCDILDNAHNLPLHLAVELGIPAAIVICGGFAWWVARQKPWAERDATRQLAWAVMAMILLHSMLEYPLWYGPFQLAFWLCVLMLRSRKTPSDLESNVKNVLNKPIAHVLRAQAAIILIAFIAYAAWDYHRISQIYLQPEARSAAYSVDTLNKARSTWLFADQVQFAELLITPLLPANAAWIFNTAKELLHYSPESRVIQKLIESAVMLGKDDEALLYLARFRAAFPKEHALWAKDNAAS